MDRYWVSGKYTMVEVDSTAAGQAGLSLAHGAATQAAQATPSNVYSV